MPAYNGGQICIKSLPISTATNTPSCSDNFTANTENKNLCTACDFKFAKLNGTCIDAKSVCKETTPNYDGKACVANSDNFKCPDGYQLDSSISEQKFCWYCDVGFKIVKGGC